MLHESMISCPYCGENFTVLVDISAGNQQYIEDCQVCCCPILFDIETGSDGELKYLNLRRDNE